jgi:hypothetical protein
MAVGCLAGCESSRDKDQKANEEASKRSRELVKEYTDKLTPEQREKIRGDFKKSAEKLEQQYHEKKLFAIAVAQGKQPPPTPWKPTQVTASSTPVVNGACPSYDNLKTGTQFRVTADTSNKYGLPDGAYELDATCRPVLIGESWKHQKEKERDAERCPPPFYGFYIGDNITIEKSEQQFFGYPPGVYHLTAYCQPNLIGADKRFSPEDREVAYKEGSARLSELQKQYFAAAMARQKEAKAAGKLEAAVSQHCPAPYEKFSPGAIAVVSSVAQGDKLIPAGNWWFDIDCKPHWYGPVRVMEPTVIEERKTEEHLRGKLATVLVWAAGIVIVLLIANFTTKSRTGRSLFAWLRGGPKGAGKRP